MSNLTHKNTNRVLLWVKTNLQKNSNRDHTKLEQRCDSLWLPRQSATYTAQPKPKNKLAAMPN